MKEFMLIFRRTPNGGRPSPEEMQSSIQKWQDWIGSIAAQGKFSSTNMLGPGGKVVRTGGTVSEGPFVETTESLGGNLILKAESLDEAATLANGCPILSIGGNVEVRPIMEINNN